MMKILPVILAIFLSLSNIQFYDGNKNPTSMNFFSDYIDIRNPRNHLTQEEADRHEVKAKVLSVSEAASKNLTINHTEGKNFSDVEKAVRDENILRLTWDIIPYAVKYAVSCEDKIFVSYTNGIEISVNDPNAKISVTALDFDSRIIEEQKAFRNHRTKYYSGTR